MSDISLPGAEARITANTSGFRAGIGQAQASLLSLEPIVARQWWGLQNLGRAFGAVGGMVAVGLGLAVREAMAWESAMVGVQRTTFDSSKSAEENAAALSKLEKELRGVAETTPIAAHELAGIAEAAGALGVSDVAEFSKITATLLATTDLTAASVEDLGRTLNVLGVPEQSFERFASTLIEVGRSTAATETEILNMARRLAPMANMAGMTADEVLGLGAAVISLGPRAEAGSSAITRMIGDISSSIAEGGEAMDNWAKVAAIPGDEFAESWRTDASATIEKVIQGLGRFEGNVVGLTETLDHLDQSNVRNVITLGALASGINDVDNQQTSLIAINKAAEEAWRENTTMAEVARQRYGTAAAQIQILRNRVADAANTVGKAMLPALRLAVSVITDFVAGFQSLPAPIQFVLGTLVAVVGAISLFAGAVLALIGPLVLMVHTLKSLRDQMTGVTAVQGAAKGSTDVMTGSLNAQIAAASRLGNVYVQLRDAQGRFAGSQLVAAKTTAATSAATAASGTAAAGASVGMARLYQNMSRLGKIGAVVAGVLAIAGVAITIFGRATRNANNEAEDAVEVNLALSDAIDQQARGISNAADEWILQEAVMSGMLDTAERLGVAMVDLIAIINGSANAEFAKPVIDGLTAQAEAGEEGARELLNWLGTTHAVYRESASAAGQLTTAREALAEQTGEAADAEGALAESADEANERIEKQAQATFDLVDAMIADRQAALDLKDAQEAYAAAVAEAADPTARLAEAEQKLQKARFDAEKSFRRLEDAENDLLTARQRQQEDLADAEDSLADARDNYLDSLEKIKDAEEALDELRRGPTMQDLIEATNKLANAQLNLREASRAVEDAEWQLAYLRGEGASARAIEDAEFALDEARQEVANATEEIGDAEQNLAEVRAGGSPEAIAAAERDLLSARRDSEGALRTISEREREVAQLRSDVAADTAYKDAQAAVTEAQLGQRDSIREVMAAEQELQRLRAGGIADELAQAQLDLEDALIRQARAATDVQKQQAALQGNFWDTAQEAHALADNIALLSANAPDAATKKRLLDYVNILRKAKSAAPEGSGGGGGARGGAGRGGGNDLTDMLPKPEETAEKADSMLRTVLESIGSLIAGRFVAYLLATILGLFGLALGGWAIALVSLIAGFLIDKFLKTEIGQKMVDGLINGLKTAADAIGRFLHSLWFDYIWGPIKTLFGIASPSTKFAELGKDLIAGLLNGLVNSVVGVLSWFGQLGGKILSTLFNFVSLLYHKGRDLFIGLKNGAVEMFVNVWNWLAGIPSSIGNIFSGAYDWLLGAGKDLITGFWNGIIELWNKAWGWIDKNIIQKVVNNPLVAWAIDSPSKLYKGYGKNLVQGLQQGIEGNLGLVDHAMNKMTDAAKMGLPETLFFDDVARQFADAADTAVAANQATYGWSGSSLPTAAPTMNEGDTIQITGADERDALDIAEEVMFKKLVRSNRG